MYRSKPNKRKSAQTFRSKVASTKSPNMAPPPMRGGYRL